MKTRLHEITINQCVVIGIAVVLFIVGVPNITSGLDILQFLDDGNVGADVIWRYALTTAGFGFVLVGAGIVLLFKSKLMGSLIHSGNRNWLLLFVAIFLVLLPWFQNISVGVNEVMVDGITVSAVIVMTITLTFSVISWSLFAWAYKKISLTGVLLGIISGACLVIPFLQVLGPMAGVIVGVVAGFVAFMFQKTMDSTTNRPVVIVAITLAAAYAVLILMVLSANVHSSTLWDTGGGVGAWTGTVEKIESPRLDHVVKTSIGFTFFVAIISSLIMTARIMQRK